MHYLKQNKSEIQIINFVFYLKTYKFVYNKFIKKNCAMNKKKNMHIKIIKYMVILQIAWKINKCTKSCVIP